MMGAAQEREKCEYLGATLGVCTDHKPYLSRATEASKIRRKHACSFHIVMESCQQDGNTQAQDEILPRGR